MLSEAANDIVQHTFGTGEGPRCLLGGDYTMATREGSSSELMIFLEGGGACNSLLCQATPVASPGMPRFGILNPEASSNPARNFNVAYLPYCDGSLFSGDTAIDTDDDGVLDTMPWDAVLDCVAFIEEADEYSDHVYCTTTVGPDGVSTCLGWMAVLWIGFPRL